MTPLAGTGRADSKHLGPLLEKHHDSIDCDSTWDFALTSFVRLELPNSAIFLEPNDVERAKQDAREIAEKLALNKRNLD